MIANIKVPQEDFEACIEADTVYDDDRIRMEDKWIVKVEDMKLTVIHISGSLSFTQNGSLTLTRYYERIIDDLIRVFEAIYPNWREG